MKGGKGTEHKEQGSLTQKSRRGPGRSAVGSGWVAGKHGQDLFLVLP